MKGHFYNNAMPQLLDSQAFFEQQAQLSSLKIRFAIKQQKKQFQRRLYGEHFNYSKVGLNKQKKYMLEEQRNTEIQRSNRILLQKIQKIAKRSVPNIIKRRAITEDSYGEILNSDDQQSSKYSRIVPNIKKASLQESSFNFHKIHSQDEKVIIHERKHIFKTNFQRNGKVFEAKAYVELNKFVLCLSIGKMNQKIKLDLQNYKQFYGSSLIRNHQNILQYLKYNGTIFELKSELQQNISLQQEQYISLPAIQQKNEYKHKFMDKPDNLLQSSLNF